MLRIYERQLRRAGAALPYSIENGIDQYVAVQAELKAARAALHIPSQGTRDQP